MKIKRRKGKITGISPIGFIIALIGLGHSVYQLQIGRFDVFVMEIILCFFVFIFSVRFEEKTEDG